MPQRPETTCCTPRPAPFPSGWAYVHSRYCVNRSLRGQKVREEDLATQARVVHPSGKSAKRRARETWMQHEFLGHMPNGD